MYRSLLLCTALWLAACCDASFGSPDGDGPGTDEPATTTLAELRRLYAGTTFRIESDVVVKGIVTTSDRSENFFRTFCIEQDGAGMEVMAGLDHLHNDYPVGCRVTLRLKGLALGESYGVLQTGRMPEAGSGFATDYLGSKPAIDIHVVRSDAPVEYPLPTLYRIPELTTARCGTLVRIDGIRYAPESVSPGTWAGYKRFADDQGAEVYTYVRSYAEFAPNPVPAGKVSLVGILQYDDTGDGRYLIKLRDESDCIR